MKIRIRQLLSTVAFLFCFSVVADAQNPLPTPIEDDQPETVFTEEIKINVSAFDRFGDFKDNVGLEDLVIIEDGRLHQANSVRRIPASVLIMLDTGGELRQAKNISQTRETAKLLMRRLSSDTSIAVVEYHDKARVLTEWTKKREKIIEDLNKKLFFGRRSIFSDALELATAVLNGSNAENRHLVLISDGTDSFWSDERRASAFQALLETDISVHVISYTRMELSDLEPRIKGTNSRNNKKTLPQEVIDTLPNGVRDVANAPRSAAISTDAKFIKTLKERRDALKNGEEFMLNLTEGSGGIFILPDDKEEMSEKAMVVAKVIDSNYVVTYTPKRPLSESEPGEIRIIEVSSKKEGLFVQARRKLVVSQRPSDQ